MMVVMAMQEPIMVAVVVDELEPLEQMVMVLLVEPGE